MSHVKTWWAAHVVWIASALSLLVPSIQTFVTSHPTAVVTALGGLVLAKIAQFEAKVSKASASATPAAPTLVKKP